MSATSANRLLLLHGSWILVLCVLAAFLLYPHGRAPIDAYAWQTVVWMTAAWAAYGFAIRAVAHKGTNQTTMYIICVFAVLFRIILVVTPPVYEDDIYRYMWDGKVLANDLNPYAFSPAEAVQSASSDAVPMDDGRGAADPLAKLQALARQDAATMASVGKINFPDIPTLYPPLTQLLFACTYRTFGMSITGFKCMFVMLDLGVVWVLMKVLSRMRQSPCMAIIYGWSPLVLKEFANSGHYDTLVILMSVAAMYFLVARRNTLACIFLGLGILAKIYPVFLLLSGWKRFRLRGVLIGVLVAVGGLLSFVLLVGVPRFQGLEAYSRHWQFNDGIFAVLHWCNRTYLHEHAVAFVHWAMERMRPGKGGLTFSSGMSSRCLAGAIYLFLLGIAIGNNPEDERSIVRNMFFASGLLYVCSPVQDPWYLCWVIPFLCIFPSKPWLMLTMLTSLYYLYLPWHHHRAWIACIEYIPFFGWMVVSWYQGKNPERHIGMGRPQA